MDFIYWVVSRDCNQTCPHCYNDSGPGAPGLTLDQIDRVVANLPDPARVPIDHIMISGGEILVWPELLFHTLSSIYKKFGDATELMVQTNGDLLDEATLDRLVDHHVSRVDIASQDKYHKAVSVRRKPEVMALLNSRGYVEMPYAGWKPLAERQKTSAFWGATEDLWIGPLWPRGRAMKNGLSKASATDKFCSLWSGGQKFLDYNFPRGHGNEVSLQLADLYPCCQMTCRPLGSLLETPLLDILDECAKNPVFQAINQGAPQRMGESLGVTQEYAEKRTLELGNECLWCDEFFAEHAPGLLHTKPTSTTRGLVDVTIAKSPRKLKSAITSAVTSASDRSVENIGTSINV